MPAKPATPSDQEPLPLTGPPGPFGQVYDIAPDGERFLMIRGTGIDTGKSELIFVQNWLEELKQRVPVP